MFPSPSLSSLRQFAHQLFKSLLLSIILQVARKKHFRKFKIKPAEEGGSNHILFSRAEAILSRMLMRLRAEGRPL